MIVGAEVQLCKRKNSQAGDTECLSRIISEEAYFWKDAHAREQFARDNADSVNSTEKPDCSEVKQFGFIRFHPPSSEG